MAVNVLPPMPAIDTELVEELFRYLSHPHPRTCHKVARMGGGVVRARSVSALYVRHLERLRNRNAGTIFLYI